MSLLVDIRKSLEKIDKKVCYGKSFDDYVKENGFDFIVFSRKGMKKSKRDITRTFEVSIVRENYIPEGLDIKIIRAITENTCLKFPNDQEMPYNYIRKGDTSDLVEILTLTFVKTETCLL